MTLTFEGSCEALIIQLCKVLCVAKKKKKFLDTTGWETFNTDK